MHGEGVNTIHRSPVLAHRECLLRVQLFSGCNYRVYTQPFFTSASSTTPSPGCLVYTQAATKCVHTILKCLLERLSSSQCSLLKEGPVPGGYGRRL
jgi:hypothetical protein